MRRPVLLVAAAALTLVLSACSGDDTATSTVLPIDDVLATEVVVTPDPSGTFAVLEVDTDIPLACSVVFGTSEAFGLIATDDDMAGGAHTDHQPRMQGLAPDTTYLYRLQGSDAAGNLYQSEVMTFTTPAATAVERPGRNVAPDATVVAVSSEFSDAFAATNAIDGDPATEWSTAGDGDDASITIDLGVVADIVGFGFQSREMSDGTAIVESFTVTVDDGETLGPFVAGTGLSIVDAAASGQVLRIDAVTTTGGNTGAVEVEVYAEG